MDFSTDGIWIVVLVVAALFAIGLAIRMIVLAFWGAIVILAFAAEQGFVGLAAYVACWVLFFPVMLIVSIVVGVGVSLVASYEFGVLAKLRRGKEERIRARQQKMRKQLGYED